MIIHGWNMYSPPGLAEPGPAEQVAAARSAVPRMSFAKLASPAASSRIGESTARRIAASDPEFLPVWRLLMRQEHPVACCPCPARAF